MKNFQVADLYFSFDEELELLANRINYVPFMTDESGNADDFLFQLSVDLDLKQTNCLEDFTYVNEIGSYGVIANNGVYEWILKRASDSEFYLMNLDLNARKAYINFEITDDFTMQAADDFTRFAFIYSAAFHHTVLLHASCIKYDDKGIAFMGHSGVGKSTHSELWLKYVEGSELVNDDQPAVHIKNNAVYIYGTPWSGKTICYKQIKVILKAILCMEQYSYTKLTPISKIELFTHLLSAASLIRTDKATLKMILATLSTISEKVKGARFLNRPDEEAALIAQKFLQNNKTSLQ